MRLETVDRCPGRRKDSGDDERILVPPKTFAMLRYLVEHFTHAAYLPELVEEVVQ